MCGMLPIAIVFFEKISTFVHHFPNILQLRCVSVQPLCMGIRPELVEQRLHPSGTHINEKTAVPVVGGTTCHATPEAVGSVLSVSSDQSTSVPAIAYARTRRHLPQSQTLPTLAPDTAYNSTGHCPLQGRGSATSVLDIAYQTIRTKEGEGT
eukprot:1846035-Rhodomonas_salina.2